MAEEKEEKVVTRFFKIAFQDVSLTKTALAFRALIAVLWASLGSIVANVMMQWSMTGHLNLDEVGRTLVSNIGHVLISYFWPSPLQSNAQSVQESTVVTETTTTQTNNKE